MNAQSCIMYIWSVFTYISYHTSSKCQKSQNAKMCAAIWRLFSRLSSQTEMGLRRSMTKRSARCIKNRVYLCAMIVSRSSICFILILILAEFMLGSIRTFSYWLRQIVICWSKSSLFVLIMSKWMFEPPSARNRSNACPEHIQSGHVFT